MNYPNTYLKHRFTTENLYDVFYLMHLKKIFFYWKPIIQ